jgi:DNA-directed RNA polymerase II subunit RPB7
MSSQKVLTHTILAHPSYFGPKLHEHIETRLHADVQGTCTGQYGFVIAVLEIVDVGNGIVLPGNGQAEFIITYKAVVFKPFKGEVLDGVVTQVLKVKLGTIRREARC